MGAIEIAVFTLAREAGIELAPGAATPWLTNRGHLNPTLRATVPASTLRLLSAIHERLGGDERALAVKRAGSSPRPDFVLRSAALIVKVDEIQHFTSDRLLTLELYPEEAQLATRSRTASKYARCARRPPACGKPTAGLAAR